MALIPMLNGKEDYNFWAIKMRTLLCSLGIWNFVTEGYTKPVDFVTEKALTLAKMAKLEENMKKDVRALYFIHQGV